jgi:hypothetical protein
VRLIWGVQGGRGSSEQEVPQRRKPTSRERRWWHRGAAEGAGNGVEGAHSVGDGGFGEGSEWQSVVAQRQWWHGGATEGAGNGVEGAHSVGDGGFGEGPERQSTVTSIAAQLWQSGSGGRKGVAPRGGVLLL